MKPTLTKSVLALFACTALAAVMLAEQQSRAVLGKIDFQALLEAVPGIPATPAEAGKRAYGTEIKADQPPFVLDTFYAPFYKKVAAARDIIKDAVANRSQNQEALAQRSRAQAAKELVFLVMAQFEIIRPRISVLLHIAGRLGQK